MDRREKTLSALSRRAFLSRSAGGFLGLSAFAGLLGEEGRLAGLGPRPSVEDGLHFPARAKRVIWLFQSDGPSHIDLYDHKPALRKFHGTELPASVRGDQRITGMTSGQTTFPCVAPMFEFSQKGQSGAWISELLPHIGQVVDKIAIVKSMHTEAINHDPAITYIQTGMQLLGRPSVGSWVSWGLGSENKNLPAYVVMISQGSGRLDPQPLFARLWGSGFLPSEHQGVKLYGGREPVLYLDNPAGVSDGARRDFLDDLGELNRARQESEGDPEIAARISQYEMAYRMQHTMPELQNLADEPESTFELYGPDAKKPGTFAANCVLARRLAERGVRFVQLYHRGWDQHDNLPKQIRMQCQDTDQASAALLRDLEARGMLKDTLVIWGGEFGRTVYSQGTLTKDNHGRDHHGRCFSMWLAGAGVRPGIVHGETDDYCWNIVKDPVHIRDLLATILHQLGIDHERLTYKYQGLEQKLTGTEPARVVKEILDSGTAL